MGLKQFIQNNRQFWWYVKDPLRLDEKAIVEGTVKYGDMEEIRQLMKILGAKNTAKIFSRQIKSRRSNYDAKTINYFKRYFKPYAK
jgi:adenylate cyclase class IV